MLLIYVSAYTYNIAYYYFNYNLYSLCSGYKTEYLDNNNISNILSVKNTIKNNALAILTEGLKTYYKLAYKISQLFIY